MRAAVGAQTAASTEMLIRARLVAGLSAVIAAAWSRSRDSRATDLEATPSQFCPTNAVVLCAGGRETIVPAGGRSSYR